MCVSLCRQDQAGQYYCKACPVGSAQGYGGMSSCNKCTSGTYQDLSGETRCKICEAGYYQDRDGEWSDYKELHNRTALFYYLYNGYLLTGVVLPVALSDCSDCSWSSPLCSVLQVVPAARPARPGFTSTTDTGSSVRRARPAPTRTWQARSV